MVIVQFFRRKRKALWLYPNIHENIDKSMCLYYIHPRLYMGGMKMSQTNLIQVRVDAELKRQAEELFADLGIDTPSAIRLFLKQAVSKNGIPFPITRPDKELKKWQELPPGIKKPIHVGKDFKIYSKEELHER
jgi:addiction module RelB/DinJ family antitoxin